MFQELKSCKILLHLFLFIFLVFTSTQLKATDWFPIGAKWYFSNYGSFGSGEVSVETTGSIIQCCERKVESDCVGPTKAKAPHQGGVRGFQDGRLGRGGGLAA